MANLPENTQYGTPSSQPSIANLSGLTKQLQQNAQKTSSSVVKGSLDSHFNVSDYGAIFGTGKTKTTKAPTDYNFPIGVPITEAFKEPTPVVPYAPGYVAPSTFTPTESLPEGYSQFTAPDANGNWVTPSSAVVARNLPLSMGGGQYVVDPTQPGKLIKSDRVIMDNKINPGVKQQVLGNLSPALFQVDHIVPLWAGGADTLKNLEVFDNVSHDKKTAIQAVPLTLLANGKITQSEAKAMALNWKTNVDDAPDINLVNDKGYLDTKVAEKYAQQWKDAISKPVGIFDKRALKYFGESFKENMDQFGEGWLPDPIREFAKGLVGGATAGIAPGTGASESSGTLGKVTNLAGNIVGMMTGIGLVGKGLGALGLMGGAAKAAAVPILEYDGIFGGAVNAAKAVTMAEGAMDTAGLVTKKAIIDAGTETVGNIAWKKQAAEMLKGAGLLGTWGQIGQTGRQLTGQEEADLGAHMSQFFSDAAFGGLTAGYGQSIKGYLGVGLSATTLSLILGGNKENSIQEALKQGALMSALHMMGAPGKFEAGGATLGVNQGLKTIASDQAFKMASARMNSVVPELVPAVMKGETPIAQTKYDIPTAENFRQQFLKENPNDPSISRMPIQTQEDVTQLITRVAINRYGKIISEARASGNDFSQEDIDAELLGFGTAGNQLYNRTLDPGTQTYGVTTDPNIKPSAREQKEIQDLQSLVTQMKSKISPSKNNLRPEPAGDYSDILNSVPLDIQPAPEITADLSNLPTGDIPITGNAKGISAKNSINIGAYDKGVKGEQHSDQLYFVLDPKNERVSRVINFAELSQGRPAPIAKPEDTIRTFYIAETPNGRQIREVGYASTGERIDTRKFNFNENFRSMMNRIRQIRKASKTPQEFYDNLLKDQSKPSLTQEEANILFAENLSKIDNKTLLTRIKAENPLQKFDSNLNNSKIAQAMRDNGLSVLTANQSKLTKSNKSGEYFLAVNIKPENWAESIAFKGKSFEPIKKQVSSAISNIQEKVSTPLKEFTEEEVQSLKKQGFTSDQISYMERSKKGPLPVSNVTPEVTPEEIAQLKKQGMSQRLIDMIKKAKVAPKTTDTSFKSLSDAELPIIKPTEAPKTAQEMSKTLNEANTLPVAETNVQSALDTIEKAPERADPGQFKQTGRGKEGINEVALKEISDPKKRSDFTRAKLTEVAKSVSGNGETRQGIIDGWPTFLNDFTQKIKTASGNDAFEISDKRDLRDLKNLYTTLASSGARNEIIISDGKAQLKEGGTQNVGKIDLLTKDFNKANGLPENSMEVVHVGKDNDYSGGDKSYVKKSSNALNTLTDEMRNKSFVPIGITGKGIENTVFVKMEPKMVEKYDQNPTKYQNEGETLTTPEDKFTRVYMVDVLGMPKNIKDVDFVKRANLIFHRYDQYLGPEQTARLRTLKAETIGDTPEFKIDTSKFENPEGVEAKASVESFHGGKTQDGPFILGEDAFDKLIEGLGYDKNRHKGSVKIILDTTLNGEKSYHKGQAIKADEAIRNSYKETHGIEIGKNDVISFDSNAKIGPKLGDFNLPLSDIYGKDRSTTGSVSKISPSGERKFLSTDVGVSENKLIKVNQDVKDLQTLIDDIAKTKSNAELKEVFDKAVEKYPQLEKENLFQGAKQLSFGELSAAKNNLHFEINKILKNLVMENAINPTYKNSTMVTMVAPIKADYDGTGKTRYVNNHEIILGSEQIKSLGVKEGDYVVVSRDPSYDINNLAVLRVVDGTKSGNTSLAEENGIVSPFNERIILQGDQDADTMHVTKIGEGGMSQAEVDAIVKRGSLATPFTEVKSSTPELATNKTIKKVIKNQLVGDDQTSMISMASRIMDEVKDNNITIKVYGESDPKKYSQYEILSNGNVVEKGTTYNSKEDFTATPKWGTKERQLISQAQREAVDSKKSDDILKRTNDDPNWATKELWSVNSGETLNPISLTGALKNIQKPYGIKALGETANTVNDIFLGKVDAKTNQRIKQTGLAPTIEYYNNLKKAGTVLTPLQEKTLAASKLKSYDVTGEQKVIIHKEGAKAVSQAFKDKYNPNNSKLKDIISIAKKAKLEYQTNPGKEGKTIREKAKQRVENYFLKNLEEGNYTEADLDNISYWAATDKLANISWAEIYNKPKFIYLYRELIDASPKVANTYYQGSESFDPFSQVITPSAQNVVETVKEGKGGPDGQGGLMDDIGTGISNAWGNVKEKLLPGLTTTFRAKEEPTYDVRGIKVKDSDIDEAAAILYGEVSNRPDKQAFETKHIINTAINRAVNDPDRYQGSLTKVLQAPYQYQAYAPQGATSSNGKVKQSEYQKLKAGLINTTDNKKLQAIKDALNEMKSGKFNDTTGGKTFYVHASDGSLWLGSTQDEAKKAANAHEKQIKGVKTKWGTVRGLPILANE
jgi:hypothetical protein